MRFSRLEDHSQTCTDSEGGGGGGGGGTGGLDFPPPLKHKNIGLLHNSCPDPLKNHKATKPIFNAGPSSA